MEDAAVLIVALSTTVFHAWVIYVSYMWLVNCTCV
jgi:hypothetical protein